MAESTKTDDDLRRRAESAIGKVLRDKWRLDRLLGMGGMAAVFAATHRNGKRAAVKVLHPEAALAPTVKDRFLREGYLANKVDHPGAVSILDDDVDVDGTVFLVMELLEGETLDARLTRSGSRLPDAEVLQVVEHVLDCLSAAHDKGIVHRDLKPGNLFITDGGAVKILDFGIARLEEVGQTRPGSTGSQTLGTPGFMPPEQARGRWDEVDAQSDLWAMGAVMFAALTGKHVHEAPTVNEQLLAAMTVPAEPLRSVVKEAPEALAVIVDRALSFAKQDRFPSARAMQDAVRAAYETLEGRPLASARRLSVRPPLASSVNPNAATLDGSAAGLLSATTARPVTETHSGTRTRSRGLVVAVAATIVVGAVAVGVSTRQGVSKDQAAASGSNAAAPGAPIAPIATGSGGAVPAATPPGAPPAPLAPSTTTATAPASTAAGATLGGAASALARGASAVRGAAARAPGAATKPLAAPPGGPAPGADVDLFTKRR